MSLTPYTVPGIVRIDLVRPGVSKPAISLILDVIETRYGITFDKLVSSDRHNPLSVVRQIAFYWMKTLCPDLTLGQIGGLFNRDHSTVCYSVKVVENRAFDFRVMHYFKRTETVFNAIAAELQQDIKYN